jgi:hypothetical protein
MKLRATLLLVSALVALTTPLGAQWQVPDHTIPIGRGPGFSGFKNATPGAAGQVLRSNGASVDPSFGAPGVHTPEDFAANGDAIRLNSSSVTIGAGSTALTVVGANFQVADIGKVISIQSAGAAAAYHTTTIAARTSATQVTLSVAAVTAVAGVAKEVVYGTDNTTAFQNACAAMVARTVKSFEHTAGKKYIVFPTAAAFSNVCAITGISGLSYDGKGSEVIVAQSTPTNTGFIYITSSSDIQIQNITGYAVAGLDSVGNGGVNWVTITGDSRNISVLDGDVNGGRAFVDGARAYASGDLNFGYNIRVSGRARNISYGAANQSYIKGHYVDIQTDNVFRSLITYGNDGPTEFNIRSRNNLSQDILLAANGHNTDVGSRTLANVRGTYINLDSTTSYPTLIIIAGQADPVVDNLTTIIENIDIKVDVAYPSGGTNGSLISNVSNGGHAGATTLADVGHIQRNIKISGTMRGRTINSPVMSIGTSALGWGTNSRVHWIVEDFEAPEQSTDPIAIGQFSRTNFRNVRMPLLAKPVFDAAPADGLNSWVACVFAGTGVTHSAEMFTGPFRVYDPRIGGTDGILFDNSTVAWFADGTNDGGSIYSDAANFIFTSYGIRDILFRTDGGTNRWRITGNATGGNFIPLTNNLSTIGNSTNTVADIHNVLQNVHGSASGIITLQPQAASGTYNWNWPISAGTSGQFLKSNGGGATAMSWSGAVVSINKQVFTSSGTYTPTAGMLYATVDCVGSGGGGGGSIGAVGQVYIGGGGGSGGYSRVIVTAATIGASKTVTIGAAGTGNSGAGGSAGADVCLTATSCVSGQICTGKGGSPGGVSGPVNQGLPGAGGVAGTGDLAAAGHPGTGGFHNEANITIYASFGGGGSSVFGGGAVSATPSGGAVTTGVAAGPYGSGGSGSSSFNVASNGTGGAGSTGVVFITEFLGQ